MRKIFIVLFFFILSTTSVKSNNHQIKREGFLSKDFKITKLSTIENAENKIILINNHGQNTNDGKQKGCTSIDQIRNRVSLVNEKVNEKTIMLFTKIYNIVVFLLCMRTAHLCLLFFGLDGSHLPQPN